MKWTLVLALLFSISKTAFGGDFGNPADGKMDDNGVVRIVLPDDVDVEVWSMEKFLEYCKFDRALQSLEASNWYFAAQVRTAIRDIRVIVLTNTTLDRVIKSGGDPKKFPVSRVINEEIWTSLISLEAMDDDHLSVLPFNEILYRLMPKKNSEPEEIWHFKHDELVEAVLNHLSSPMPPDDFEALLEFAGVEEKYYLKNLDQLPGELNEVLKSIYFKPHSYETIVKIAFVHSYHHVVIEKDGRFLGPTLREVFEPLFRDFRADWLTSDAAVSRVASKAGPTFSKYYYSAGESTVEKILSLMKQSDHVLVKDYLIVKQANEERVLEIAQALHDEAAQVVVAFKEDLAKLKKTSNLFGKRERKIKALKKAAEEKLEGLISEFDAQAKEIFVAEYQHVLDSSLEEYGVMALMLALDIARLRGPQYYPFYEKRLGEAIREQIGSIFELQLEVR